jgi:hypothetical protein
MTDNQSRTNEIQYMTVSRKTHNQYKNTGIGGHRFERVSSSPYLGSIINEVTAYQKK